MTEKRQTSQGYIIRILQHFATKLQTCLDQNFTQKGKGLFKSFNKLLRELRYCNNVLLNPNGNRMVMTARAKLKPGALHFELFRT
jgi:hypothetical protein